MLVTFGLLILDQFWYDTCFIHQNPYFLLQYTSSVFHFWLSLYMYTEIKRAVRKQGGEGGFMWLAKTFHGCAHGIILAQYLLCQDETFMLVPSLALGTAGDW